MTTPMMCLTVRQPWATALVRGVKKVENRSWPPGRGLAVGDWLAIHAGSARPVPSNVHWPAEPDEHWLSAVIGAVRFCGHTPYRPGLGPWAGGEPWCWRFDDAVEFEVPIPVAGRLRLWPAPPLAVRRLRAGLELRARS